jgi:hypothetical protein
MRLFLPPLQKSLALRLPVAQPPLVFSSAILFSNSSRSECVAKLSNQTIHPVKSGGGNVQKCRSDCKSKAAIMRMGKYVLRALC